MRRADVSFGMRQAEVSFDPARVTVERMIAALGQLGYRARVERTEER